MNQFPIQIPTPQTPAFPAVPVSPPAQVPGAVPSGQAGLNAYQLAVLGAPGVPPFEGTMAEWLLAQKGDPGSNVELALGDTHIQWRITGSEEWENLVAISELVGPVSTTPGPPGDSVELQTNSTHIQWRRIGSPSWTDIIPITSLVGPASTTPGPAIELQVGLTHIQWRVVGATTWSDLIAVSSLVGAPGPPADSSTVATALNAAPALTDDVPNPAVESVLVKQNSAWKRWSLANVVSYLKTAIFSGSVEAAGPLTAIGQPALASLGSSHVLTKGLADVGYLNAEWFPVVAAPVTISGSVNNMTTMPPPSYHVGYGGTVVAGTSAHGISIAPPSIVAAGKDYFFTTPTGSGPYIDFFIPWSIKFTFICPFNASDDIIRFAVGDSNTVAGSVRLFGANGFGLRLNKKVGTSLMYEARIYGKTFNGYLTTQITGVTNASPIVVTTNQGHGLVDGDTIEVNGVAGTTAANGIFVISNVTASTFTLLNLNGSNTTGNGTWTSGGVYAKVSGIYEIAARQAHTIILTNTIRGCEMRIGNITNAPVLSLVGINSTENTSNVRVGSSLIKASIQSVTGPTAYAHVAFANIGFIKPS